MGREVLAGPGTVSSLSHARAVEGVLGKDAPWQRSGQDRRQRLSLSVVLGRGGSGRVTPQPSASLLSSQSVAAG